MKIYNMSGVSQLYVFRKVPFGPRFIRVTSRCVNPLMFQRCKCIQCRFSLFSWHGKLVRNSMILRECGCFLRQRLSVNHRCAAGEQESA